MRRIHPKQLAAAVEILRQGGVVLFPSESSYGLAADAAQWRAVQKIWRLKRRPRGKAPPLIVADLAMAEAYGEFNQAERKAARHFWPGALTLIVRAKSKNGLAKAVQSPDGRVALRVPGLSAPRALARYLGRPIVATSANLSGAMSCYSVGAWEKQAVGCRGVDYILDAGALPHRAPSTLVIWNKGTWRVLRAGQVRWPKDWRG